MQSNLIPQISKGCMEMKGEEINIRTSGGSNKNAVEGKKTKQKKSARAHAHIHTQGGMQLSRSILE